MVRFIAKHRKNPDISTSSTAIYIMICAVMAKGTKEAWKDQVLSPDLLGDMLKAQGIGS
jgi:hypothetical protein